MECFDSVVRQETCKVEGESLPHSYEASHVTWHGLLATKKQLGTKMSVAE